MITQEEIDKAAEEYMNKTVVNENAEVHSKDLKDYTIIDFEAGVKWVLNKLNTQTSKDLQDEIDHWYKETASLTSEVIIRRAYSLGATEGNDLSKVDRFEVIDHSKDLKGKCYFKHDCSIELSLQDGKRTLKVFVNDK
jgi:hypothetical protein